MAFTVTLWHEKRTPRRDGTYPVKLRITIDRETRYYSLEKNYSEKEFKKVVAGKTEPYNKVLAELENKRNEAIRILSALPNPNFKRFKQLFKLQSKGANVVAYFDQAIKDRYNDGFVSTASTYECAKNSLDGLMGITELNFKDITVSWLKDYELKMKRKGKSVTTVKFYLGCLKAIYRQAITDGVVKKEHYPFNEYRIPKAVNNKRPLERDELKLIAEYNGDELTMRYRDFFLLSYFLMGLNFADMLTMKWNQLDGNILEVLRKKTETTAREQRKIQLVINSKAHAIIERYGNPVGKYVFDIINPKDDPDEVRRKVKNTCRAVNQALERICKAVGIKKKVSTTFARHSAATHSMNAGATLADISQALGHTNLKTTSDYLSSLESGKRLIADSLEI